MDGSPIQSMCLHDNNDGCPSGKTVPRRADLLADQPWMVVCTHQKSPRPPAAVSSVASVARDSAAT